MIAIIEPSNHVHVAILGSYAHILLVSHTHISSKYWSGQNRTNRTACGGPVLSKVPLYLHTLILVMVAIFAGDQGRSEAKSFKAAYVLILLT